MENQVSLRRVTKDTLRVVCGLSVAPDQQTFVASNAVSIAEAHFEPKAWFRAIYAGETPVGFIMLFADEEKPEYVVWRLMVANGHQRNGYAKRAVAMLVEHVRTLPGASELFTSYVPGKLGPEVFWKSCGFTPTGEVDDGEIVCVLTV